MPCQELEAAKSDEIDIQQEQPAIESVKFPIPPNEHSPSAIAASAATVLVESPVPTLSGITKVRCFFCVQILLHTHHRQSSSVNSTDALSRSHTDEASYAPQYVPLSQLLLYGTHTV